MTVAETCSMTARRNMDKVRRPYAMAAGGLAGNSNIKNHFDLCYRFMLLLWPGNALAVGSMRVLA
jgi:hypothetical protein